MLQELGSGCWAGVTVELGSGCRAGVAVESVSGWGTGVAVELGSGWGAGSCSAGIGSFLLWKISISNCGWRKVRFIEQIPVVRENAGTLKC